MPQQTNVNQAFEHEYQTFGTQMQHDKTNLNLSKNLFNGTPNMASL